MDKVMMRGSQIEQTNWVLSSHRISMQGREGKFFFLNKKVCTRISA